MDSRREFIKKAALLSGAAGIFSTLPSSIVRALTIDPKLGSTYLDAEHIVVLMQENRSFDHCYGTLKGVRGFNDPRAITLPDKKPVWLQTNAAGQTYAPFRLNIKETKSTWLGSLPHSWTNQVDAGNNGKHDKWLDAKPSGRKGFTAVPLTMGYYNREDIPFYYAMADAFTVCDQNFSSSLTGTTPNRLYLWTGTVRAEQHAGSPAKVRNEDVDYKREVNWKTFPERLEENNISWKIYQNEISLESGFEGEEDAWLSNFTDNPIEWFSQYHVRFSASFRNYLKKMEAQLPVEIQSLESKIANVLVSLKDRDDFNKTLQQKQALLKLVKEEKLKWTDENFENLSQKEKNLHAKAFCTNAGDPNFRQLKTIEYQDGDTKRQVKVPKGDILHQFRKDVNEGQLPAVSWIVAPENFSDHPGAPWYGAWYISEVMDILTKDPEVWKKTIFILCYDENDGYYDHVPPFTPPQAGNAVSGKVSAGIDAGVEFVSFAQDKQGREEKSARESTIGLGYRVPLLIASPWSRGGTVCSQVFDHTSVLQFMEHFLSHKTGKEIRESNISAWRRAVCGDLTSVFKPYNGEKIPLPTFPDKETFIESIHQSQFKKDPVGYQRLTKEDVDQLTKNPAGSSLLPRQEKGIRPSCALPYQLYAEGKLSADRKQVELYFSAKNEVFGKRTAGAPFLVYDADRNKRSYALSAGDSLRDTWMIDSVYHFEVYGPNGFYRSFKGDSNDPLLDVNCEYEFSGKDKKKLTGNLVLNISNLSKDKTCSLEIRDNAYKGKVASVTLKSGASNVIPITDLSRSFGWYDISITVQGAASFEKRYAGRVETGTDGFSDPAMA